jgi:ubiquinone/menaquinone biosynthesis C-methylase UbiE
MTATRPVPNHHADHPGFSGVVGLLAGLTMTLGREGDARLAAELTEMVAGDRVVDVGCGPGSAARYASRRGARSVTGVDPSAVMLRLARRLTNQRPNTVNGAAVTFVEGVAEALPLPDDGADVLWALATVHHWPDLDAALSEARRVLASGGRFVAIERRSPDGARGLASHGWTEAQANAFADQVRDAGLTDVRVASRRMRRRDVLAVTGRNP